MNIKNTFDSLIARLVHLGTTLWASMGRLAKLARRSRNTTAMVPLIPLDSPPSWVIPCGTSPGSLIRLASDSQMWQQAIFQSLLREQQRLLSTGPVTIGRSPLPEIALKETEGKHRYDLVPPGPLLEIVKVYDFGAKKYADENWRKGRPWKDCFAAMLRHVEAARGGEWINAESGLAHVAHAAWWCIALLEYSKTHPELNNLVDYERETVRASIPEPTA